MAPESMPAYAFDFSGGLSWRGAAIRTTPHFAEGEPQAFRFAIDDSPLVRPLGVSLPPILADLIDIFSAIRLADGRAPRTVPDDPRSPSHRLARRMRWVIGIRLPQVWDQVEVREALEGVLGPLLGDDTDVRFVRRSEIPRRSESPVLRFDELMPKRPAVILHSGGLDSLLGLLRAQQMGDYDEILAVTLVTHPQIRALARGVLDRLGTHRKSGAPSFLGLRVGLHQRNSGWSYADRESSQRSRILPSLAAGIAVAALAQTDELLITENGFGAINLRYSPGQSSSKLNRATHPRTLDAVARLASILLGRPVRILNNGLFLTKAELLRTAVCEQQFETVKATASCERLPWLPASRACGTCASCILRRMSLVAAGLAELDDAAHRQLDNDFLRLPADPGRCEFVPLLAFAAQAEMLRTALSSTRPFAALRSRFPDLIDLEFESSSLGLEPTDLERRVVRL